MKIMFGFVVALGLVVGSVDAQAGRVDGPIKTDPHALQPGESKTVRTVFEKEVIASVEVTGEGEGDIDCYLTDIDGQMMDMDTSPENYCTLMFVPERTESFHIRITNAGKTPVTYVTETN